MNEFILTKSNFEAEVINSSVPVLVDFWASWCGPCKMIAPVIEEIADEFDGQIKVGKVNVDDEQELAMAFGVMSIPTVLLFENGQVVKSLVGYRTKQALVEELGL